LFGKAWVKCGNTFDRRHASGNGQIAFAPPNIFLSDAAFGRFRFYAKKRFIPTGLSRFAFSGVSGMAASVS